MINKLMTATKVTAATNEEALAFVQKGLDKCFKGSTLKAKLLPEDQGMEAQPAIYVKGKINGLDLAMDIALVDGQVIFDEYDSPSRPRVGGNSDLLGVAIKKNQNLKKADKAFQQELQELDLIQGEFAVYTDYVKSMQKFVAYLANGTQTK